MPSAFRILVTLGGSDPSNITPTAIEGLRLGWSGNFQARVIAGALNPNLDQIKTMVDSDERFEVLVDVTDMATQYRWADLAVSAGGSSNWEMCFFGLPRVVIVTAENQQEIAGELARLHIATNLGWAEEVTPERIADALRQWLADDRRCRLARQESQSLVDGLGANRVVRYLGSPVANLAADPGKNEIRDP